VSKKNAKSGIEKISQSSIKIQPYSLTDQIEQLLSLCLMPSSAKLFTIEVFLISKSVNLTNKKWLRKALYEPGSHF
jgi:hypothetical protein